VTSVRRATPENKSLPTQMAGIVREALDEDSRQFLSAVSHGYKTCAEYDMDVVVRFPSLISVFLIFLHKAQVIINFSESDL
jgi:hypothetical protein